MILFFCAFSTDRLLHRQVGNWHSGVEPYGFLALVICLSYITAQRIIADDTRLISLNDEMRAATRIQKAILPGVLPILENAKIAVRYAPMADVAGDLYDFVTTDPHRVGVLVADVMGHGVPAALVASMVKVAVSTQCRNAGGPAGIISGLNNVLCKEAREQYVTAEYLYLDTASGIGRHAASAHPSPLLWRQKAQTLEKLGESGLLLGVRADEAYYESEFHFEAGDRLLLYTDGLTEAENSSGEPFGEVALSAFIRDKRNFGTEQFADFLLREAIAWSRDGRGKRQEDDITFVVIDLKGETKDDAVHVEQPTAA
jgi:sigma-B regulation protein RsbU (phosphoserine phosphatase)